jgi:hypothetical protein
MLSNLINNLSGIINSSVSAVMGDDTKTKTIETVIFQNLIRVNLIPKYIGGDICQSLVFPANEVPSTTVSYETLLELFHKYRPGYNLSVLDELASEHTALMNSALEGYPKEIQEILRADILDLAHYHQYNLELWDITQLCIKYDIAPVDVFVALVADASPFGMGALAFPTTGNQGLAEKARADFQEKLAQNKAYFDFEWFIHFDYWNGIGVKTMFPKDIHQHPMQVNIRRYNDRNGYQGYHRIIKLFAARLSDILAQQ